MRDQLRKFELEDYTIEYVIKFTNSVLGVRTTIMMKFLDKYTMKLRSQLLAKEHKWEVAEVSLFSFHYLTFLMSHDHINVRSDRDRHFKAEISVKS